MTTPAYEAGRRAFIPGWTNASEHSPYPLGSDDHRQFAAGWDRESALCEHGLNIE